MNFSSPIKYSGNAYFSPNNKYFCLIKGVEVHLYDCKTLSFVRKFSFNDQISYVEWSPDSNLLLIAFLKVAITEIKSLDNPEWHCKIEEGVAGLEFARWSPDSRRVLTICSFNLRLTIWSLIDRSTNFINYPKFSDKGLCFTSNNYFMALAERKESKDYIGLYYIADWTLVSHFAVDTVDLQDILLSKDGSEIIVYDRSLEFKFYVYSPTGNLIFSYQAYDLGLGIKNCLFSPNGHYLSVGYYDQSVRLFSQVTWKFITELQHKNIINNDSVYVFREEEQDTYQYSGEVKKIVKYSLVESKPFKLISVKPNDRINPLFGVSEMVWSFDSAFIATKNDNMPNVIWIWQISNLSLYSIAVQIKPVKHFSWSPKEHILIILTENNKVYVLTLTDGSVCPIVTDNNLNLSLNKVIWASDGKSYIIGDKSYMFIGTPIINDSNDNENKYDKSNDKEEDLVIEDGNHEENKDYSQI